MQGIDLSGGYDFACQLQYMRFLEKAIQRNFCCSEFSPWSSLSPVTKEEAGKLAKVIANASLYALNIRNVTGIPSA